MTWIEDIDTLADAYAADVALGSVYTDEAIVDPPTTALGWGSDLEGWQDLTHEMRERSGDDPLVVVESILRRINTVKGSLPDDDDPDVATYGEDVLELLNRGMTEKQLAAKTVVFEAEIKKEDRVGTVTVDLTRIQGAIEELEMFIAGELVLPDATKPFTMTLAVTSAGAILKALSV